ncbi:histidine utilization protein HutD [Trinickia symbiotica]|uniref:Histidine utilization protein HutD n=1 Tax=Trinickia symbiotica TaxID=863227 RepID=A0A2T3XLE8_9BURK|nr:HutD family protein [Trinickia symbiotica]PTB17287.1 histidine utilization protein HutD [Trinickia symbiotica]
MTNTTLIRGAGLVASPWKNGGGVTREVAAFPEGAALDAFVWRVSVADVAQAGPFSRFAGIDRTLALLSGAGMLLDEAGGVTHALRAPLDIARFPGETAVDARLVDGATRDFNLMVRRGAATGDVDVWRDVHRAQLDADVALLFCAHGELHVTTGDSASESTTTLETNDTLRIDDARALACEIKGTGALVAVAIRYTEPSQAR